MPIENRLINVCLAHEALWNIGVLHRDISVNNIMLSPAKAEEARRHGFLIDFDYALLEAILNALDAAAEAPADPAANGENTTEAATQSKASVDLDPEVLFHRTVRTTYR